MKKMRKLIPAFAMLMVAAIMMTTASFAWFTMNENVTVEGMQIKAKASGSLIISQAPIYDGNLGGDGVEIATSVKNLLPMTYDTNLKWAKPSDNKVNNVTTGMAGSALESISGDDIGSYNYWEEFYIATAGDVMKDTDVTVTLSGVAPAAGQTYKAYAAAIYVVPQTVTVDGTTSVNALWADGKDADFMNVAPTKIVYVDAVGGRNTVTLEDVTIPSVTGAVGEANAVGLKVVVHFFVDGALDAKKVENNTVVADKIDVTHNAIYTQDLAKYDVNKAYVKFTATPVTTTLTADVSDVSAYYTEATVNGKKVYTPAYGTAVDGVTYYEIEATTPIPTQADMDANTVPADWYTSAANIIKVPYTYVRSADIPSNGTALTISFSATLPTT